MPAGIENEAAGLQTPLAVYNDGSGNHISVVVLTDAAGNVIGTAAHPVITSGGAGGGSVNIVQINSLAVQTGHGTAAGTLRVELPTDGTGQVAISQVTPGTTNAITITDTSAHVATLFQSHNADNQQLGGSAYAINTAGVTQLLNAMGTQDRARTTSFDNAAGTGIPAGSQQFAVPKSTTLAQAVTANAGAQSVQVASSSNMLVGDYVAIAGANPENVFVTAIADSTHFTAVFAKNHSNTDPVSWFHYNVARDAANGDAVALTGLSASMTYLWNKVAGTAELERSAAAELDYASGNGTAIAAGYEFNAIGFDRERNLMGKGLTQATITATSGADVNLTFSADPSTAANGSLKPGAILILSTGIPTPLTGDIVQVGTGYVSGTTVPVTPIGNTTSITAGRTRATWSSFAALGPGSTGFIPDGLGCEEEVVYNPVDGMYYGTVSYTGDARAGANMESVGLVAWNGASADRLQVDANKQLKIVSAGYMATPSSSFVRPANTTAYSSGQLVANSTVAASVVPLSWTAARLAAGSFSVRRGRITLNNAVGGANAAFRIHLFTASPTVATTGDAGVFSTVVSGFASYVGYIDVTSSYTFADGVTGVGAPGNGNDINVSLGSGQTLFGLLEARAAYVPTSGETITVFLEILQN